MWLWLWVLVYWALPQAKAAAMVAPMSVGLVNGSGAQFAVYDPAVCPSRLHPHGAARTARARLSIVVAVSWGRSLQWLRRLAIKLPVFLYSNFPQPRNKYHNVPWLVVQMKGRILNEHHAYLAHMAACYDELTTMVAFLQEDSHDLEYRSDTFSTYAQPGGGARIDKRSSKALGLHGGDVIAKLRSIARASGIVSFIPLGWFEGVAPNYKTTDFRERGAAELKNGLREFRVGVPGFPVGRQTSLDCTARNPHSNREWLRMVLPEPALVLPLSRARWVKALFVASAQRIKESHTRAWYRSMLNLSLTPGFEKTTGWCFEVSWVDIFGRCPVGSWTHCGCGQDCGPCVLLNANAPEGTGPPCSQPLPTYTQPVLHCEMASRFRHRGNSSPSSDQDSPDKNNSPPGPWVNLYCLQVSQSSTMYGGGPERAIDGDANIMWQGGPRACTHTAQDYGPWWQVKLRNTISVAAVKVTNRFYHGDRLKGLLITVDGHTCASNITVGPGDTSEIMCTSVLAGTTVRLEIPARKEFLSLCEVAVKAHRTAPVSPPSPSLATPPPLLPR